MVGRLMDEDEKETLQPTNDYGDCMTQFDWDGGADDEEVGELVALKTPWEQQHNVKFSRDGIIDIIEKMLAQEGPLNKAAPKVAKLWEQKLKDPTI